MPKATLEDVDKSVQFMLLWIETAAAELESLKESADTVREKISQNNLDNLDSEFHAAIEDIKTIARLDFEDWTEAIKHIKGSPQSILQCLHDAEVPGYGADLT